MAGRPKKVVGGVESITGHEKEPKKVEVNADALERLVKDNEAFRERITTLEAVADKSRLAWYEGLNPKKKSLTQVSLGLYPTEKR